MNHPEKQLMTKADYARRCGWDRSYLSAKATKVRIAPAIEKDEHGRERINVALADKIFRRETDTAKVRKPQPAAITEQAATDPDELLDDGPNMDAHRRENIKLKNENLALKLAEQKGQTLHRDGVISAAAAAGQKIREALSARNREIAEKFATMTDARQILVAMEESDREMLERISADFMRKLKAPHATKH